MISDLNFTLRNKINKTFIEKSAEYVKDYIEESNESVKDYIEESAEYIKYNQYNKYIHHVRYKIENSINNEK